MVCLVLRNRRHRSHLFRSMLTDNIHATTFLLPEFEFNPEGDILAVDKPRRCTSFDMVKKIRHIIQRKVNQKVKVGHAGTLDPLATGLLLICVGKMTRKIDTIQALVKEYVGTVRLGATTLSYDMEYPINEEYPYRHITRESAQAATRQFLGDILQIPPQHSAVRVGGRRAYEYARVGSEAPIEPKKVTIYDFDIIRFELPEMDFRISCSKGTYIRAIARDFGSALQSGAYLTALRRTKIGHYDVDNAIKPVIVNVDA